MTTYSCNKPDCVGGEVDMWDDGIVPSCWGWAGDDPHPMTKLEEYDPWADYSNPLHPYHSRDIDRI